MERQMEVTSEEKLILDILNSYGVDPEEARNEFSLSAALRAIKNYNEKKTSDLEEQLTEKERVNCQAEWSYSQFEKEAKTEGKVEQEKHFLMMKALHHGIMTGIGEAKEIMK